MKKFLTWIAHSSRWLIFTICSLPLILWFGWALSHRTVALLGFVIVWVGHLALGVVAVVAASRLWRSWHVPLLRWLWLYLNAFVIDVLSAIVLLFVAKGVKFTWKFSAVMFISTLLSDLVRAPLLFSLIRGQNHTPTKKESQTSGEQPPQFWLDSFREIVREEIERTIAQMRQDDEKKDRPHPPEPQPQPSPRPQPQDDPLPPNPGDVPGPGKNP